MPPGARVPLGVSPSSSLFVGRCVRGARRLCVGCGLGSSLGGGGVVADNTALEAAQSRAGAVGSEVQPGSVCQVGGGR